MKLARSLCLVISVAAMAFGLGGCILGPKSAEVPSAAIIQYPMRELELPSGMRVLLEQAPDFGVAGAALVVGSGSADESPAKAGLAHLTEHLAFEATHAGVSLAAMRDDLGTTTNAYTGWDETAFYAFESSRSLPELVGFLAGVVRDPLAGVDERLFQRDWQVVGDELQFRTETGTPGQAVGWLMAEVFPDNHAYAHSIGGTQATLAGLTLDDVRAFAAANYRPQSSTLVVSAPLSLDEQQAMVEQAMGEQARMRSPGPNLRLKDRAGALDTPPRSLRTYESEVPTPTLWIGWSVPSAYGDSGHLPLLLKSTVVSTLRGSVLRRDADIAEVDANVERGTVASLFWVRVALKQGKHPEATAQSIVDELEGSLGKLSSWGVTSAEMRRYVATGYKYDEEEMTTRTMSSALSYHWLGLPTFLRDRGEHILGSSADEATDFAHTFLSSKRAHMVLVRPQAAANTASLAARPRARSAGLAAPASTPASVAVSAAKSTAQVGHPPLLGAIETHDLPNGLKLILLPRPGSPFHTVLLGFKGGRVHAVPPGVATAMNWARETDERSPDLWGVDHRYYVSAGGNFDVLRSTGKDVRGTLHHLRRMLGFSIFWPPRRYTELMTVLAQQDLAPAAILNRRTATALFGAHPAGNLATAEDMKKIAPIQVLRWVDRVRHPHNGVVIIVGDIDVKDALDAATDEIGHWAAAAAPRSTIGSPTPLDEIGSGESGQLFVQDRPGAQEASVHLRCLLPPATPDNVGARLIFAQGFERKMRQALREELAGSYSVHGRATVVPGGTAVFDLTADVVYSHLSESLRRLRTMLVASDTEFARIRGMLVEAPGFVPRWALNLESTRDMAEYFFDMWVGGWPLDSIDLFPAQVRDTSEQQIAEVAQHCRQNWVVGLLGDERRLREAWSAAAP